MRGLLLALVVGLAAVSAAHAADAAGDAHLTGYARAVLEREFHAGTASLRVDRGVITLDAADLGGAERSRVIEELSRIRGVTRVEIEEREHAGLKPDLPPSTADRVPIQREALPEADGSHAAELRIVEVGMV